MVYLLKICCDGNEKLVIKLAESLAGASAVGKLTSSWRIDNTLEEAHGLVLAYFKCLGNFGRHFYLKQTI